MYSGGTESADINNDWYNYSSPGDLSIQFEVSGFDIPGPSGAADEAEKTFIEYLRVRLEKRKIYSLDCEYINVLNSPDRDVLEVSGFDVPGPSGAADEPQETFIEVPKWRVCEFTYSDTEEHENLDDSIFLKRHLKMEKKEKRLRRQKIQEKRKEELRLKQINRIQAKEEANTKRLNLKKPSIEEYDIIPEKFSVQYIEISDETPIKPFGTLIPNFPPCEFQLPWLSNRPTNTKYFLRKTKD